jgi:hypothetical protein
MISLPQIHAILKSTEDIFKIYPLLYYNRKVMFAIIILKRSSIRYLFFIENEPLLLKCVF